MTNQEYKEQGYICLYIFTHNITGLKYFGKTRVNFTEKELLKYGGSGKYWNRHLKKHGKDLSVEIYGIYKIKEVKEIALKFSKDNNIVKELNESGERKGKKVWANEKPENGLDGNPEGNRLSPKSYSKGVGTCRNNVIDGVDGLKRKGIKSAATNKKRNNYREASNKRTKTIINGIGFEEISRRISVSLHISDKDGNTPIINAAKTRKITMSQEINGTKRTKITIDKLTETLRNDVDENNKNGLERRANNTVKTKSLIDEDSLSGFDKIAKKISDTCREKNTLYVICHKNGDVYLDNLILSDVKKLSQAYTKTSKDKPLGHNKISASRLIKNGKKHLIGTYLLSKLHS